jgi:hypothetical protein
MPISLGYADWHSLGSTGEPGSATSIRPFLAKTDHPDRRFSGPGREQNRFLLLGHDYRQTGEAEVYRKSTSLNRRVISTVRQVRVSARSPREHRLRIVTERAIFGFDEEDTLMRLEEVAPWTTLEDVLDRMDFKPLLAEPMGVMQMPTEEDLSMIRAEIDPGGYTLNRGEWLMVTV